ncbi:MULTISPECIES: arginine repressor [unclassified Thermoanaerobacterium]|uniref:arginine repressor n=1 Tax=unclassified Thermoanaerobacterium TaxID=2622527 RepID=UPI000A168FD3|nr:MULTISPECIES: arginine repressor [unclassified Thermoanaerobacterium]MDE4543167.1 arginine repressor [Thermoanaerobacterium sp. R66]ORX23617.1 arginine repressor [Thermoanaerobacterium sp. PSU-2]HHV74292.1 arginine repressor [Thermoanaerobacterium sp.]
MTKLDRHNKILKIIKEKDIENQEELVNELQKEGFIVTQATISRDIKELKLVKILSSDGKRYKYSTRDVNENITLDKFLSLLSKVIVDVDYSGNIIAIKTLSGAASSAAEAIDELNWSEIVGTIAGNNTIFVLVDKDDNVKEVIDRLKKIVDTQMGENIKKLS